MLRGGRRGAEVRGDLYGPEVRACAAQFLSETQAALACLCARACEREVESSPGMWEGAVREWPSLGVCESGVLLCGVGWLGGAAPRTGRPGRRGPGNRDGWASCSSELPSPGLFFVPARFRGLGSVAREAAFRVESFVTPEDSRRSGGGGWKEGRNGPLRARWRRNTEIEVERGEEVGDWLAAAPPHVVAIVSVEVFSRATRRFGRYRRCTSVLRLGTFGAGLGLGKNARNVAWEEIRNFVGDLLLLVD